MATPEYNKAYRLANKEKLRQYNSEYWANNKSAIVKRQLKNRQDNVVYQNKQSECGANWRAKNSGYIKNYKKAYYKKNKAKLIEKSRIYVSHKRKTDPLFKAKDAARHLVYLAITKMGYRKKGRTETVLGCSFTEFKAYIEQQFKPGMTWLSHGEWHIDHKSPLASAMTEEEVLKLNHYSNLQPLWAEENLTKGAKLIYA